MCCIRQYDCEARGASSECKKNRRSSLFSSMRVKRSAGRSCAVAKGLPEWGKKAHLKFESSSRESARDGPGLGQGWAAYSTR